MSYDVHVNDVSTKSLRDLLPYATIITDGDCGSVWGEYHDNGTVCQWPHSIVRVESLLAAEILTLREQGIGFVVTTTADWFIDLTQFLWVEDPWCQSREDHNKDYRRPFGRLPAFVRLVRERDYRRPFGWRPTPIRLVHRLPVWQALFSVWLLAAGLAGIVASLTGGPWWYSILGALLLVEAGVLWYRRRP